MRTIKLDEAGLASFVKSVNITPESLRTLADDLERLQELEIPQLNETGDEDEFREITIKLNDHGVVGYIVQRHNGYILGEEVTLAREQLYQ
ncbi:MAG: hypothetical protein WC796_05290 [Candidatus Pacearchaeota archaeon]|jgi:hypothetical protein